MLIKLRCPHCDAGLSVPEKAAGRTLPCPRCKAPVTVEEPDPGYEILDAPPAPAYDVLEEAEVVEEAVPDPVPAAPPKKRKKKKKRQGFMARLGLPPIAVDEGLVKVGCFGFAVLAFGACLFFAVPAALRTPAPPPIPDEQWQLVEAGGCKVLMPGAATAKDQNIAGVKFTMYSYQPDKWSIYGLAYTTGELPEPRRSWPVEQILTDSVDGSAANLTQMGAREEKRGDVKLGEYPGKFLAMYIPQADGYMLSRVFYAGGRLFIVMCGGSGLREGNHNAKKMFDSLQIVDPEDMGGSGGDATGALRRLALGLHNYESSHGQFPAAAGINKDDKPLLSWRVAILPYIGEEQLYKEFKLDEPWDGPNNKKLLAKMPAVFAPPGKKNATDTHLRVLVGNGAMFDLMKGTTITKVTDGMSNTLMVVEAAEAVPWTKPEGIVYDPAGPLPKFGRDKAKSFAFCLADASTRSLPKDADEKQVRALITKNGGERQ